ncbi:hypothetical protein PACILC2_01610 [Paenibacillus cisolokensis]|uniref:Uncharacterized protein n=1 Tax=Paenibacillus cisolokensis TaxID=1658519 RepID=A0ABQ4N0E5_9BACL|nr:hypothetical protein PACILC2_01610 [Paenibacillus cisolokensis]
MVKRATVLVFGQTEEVLQIRVLQNLTKRLTIIGAQPLLDDQGAESDTDSIQPSDP